MASKQSKKALTIKKPKQKMRRNSKVRTIETDGVFFLKAVVFLILGTQWVYLTGFPDWQVPVPVGLVVGLVLATHEHFKIDRKIEYVLLLVSAFIAYWLPIGLIIQV
jgi:hypothetical protein